MNIPLNPLLYALISAAHSAPSADNSQPWHFYWSGNNLSVAYDHNRVDGQTFPAWAPATLLSIGGVIENLAKASEAMELATSLEILPQDCAIPACYVRISAGEPEKTDQDPKQNLLLGRHTNRFRFAKTPIPAEILETLSQSGEGDAHVAGIVDRKDIAAVAALVRSASEVRFQTQEIHEWLGASLRFTRSEIDSADGLDVHTLDLPPGGQLFLRFISEWKRMRLLNQIGGYKLLAGIDSAPVKKAPCILAITGKKGNRGALDAGRLLARTWTHLNAEGLAVHPYYVVADQLFRLKEGTVPQPLVGQVEQIEAQTRRLLDLGKEHALYMLLRVGYPTREATRSRRLPLEKVFTDLTLNT